MTGLFSFKEHTMSRLYLLRIRETREKTVPLRAQTIATARSKALSRLEHGLIDLSDVKPKVRIAVMNMMGQRLLCQEVA